MLRKKFRLTPTFYRKETRGIPDRVAGAFWAGGSSAGPKAAMHRPQHLYTPYRSRCKSRLPVFFIYFLVSISSKSHYFYRFFNARSSRIARPCSCFCCKKNRIPPPGGRRNNRAAAKGFTRFLRHHRESNIFPGYCMDNERDTAMPLRAASGFRRAEPFRRAAGLRPVRGMRHATIVWRYHLMQKDA